MINSINSRWSKKLFNTSWPVHFDLYRLKNNLTPSRFRIDNLTIQHIRELGPSFLAYRTIFESRFGSVAYLPHFLEDSELEVFAVLYRNYINIGCYSGSLGDFCRNAIRILFCMPRTEFNHSNMFFWIIDDN